MSQRKPPETRQRRGTPDAGSSAELALVEAPELEPYTVKVEGIAVELDILPVVHDAWAAFWESDVAKFVKRVDHHSLRRLFRMYDQRERMEEEFMADPITLGSQKQLVAHPAAKIMASLDARISQLEARFGITPKARLELGITVGEAAKSLDSVNAALDPGDDIEEDEDPR